MKVEIRKIRHLQIPANAKSGLDKYFVFVEHKGMVADTTFIYLLQGEPYVYRFNTLLVVPKFVRDRVVSRHRIKFEKRIQRLLNWQNFCH